MSEVGQSLKSEEDYLHFNFPNSMEWTSLIVQLVKNPPAMQETLIRFLGQEDLLEKGWLPTPVFWPREFHGLYSP